MSVARIDAQPLGLTGLLHNSIVTLGERTTNVATTLRDLNVVLEAALADEPERPLAELAELGGYCTEEVRRSVVRHAGQAAWVSSLHEQEKSL